MTRTVTLILFVFLPGLLAGQTVRGSIKDAKTGKPLPFANVFLNNSTVGATSGEDGNFSFAAPVGHAELIASYVGYITQTRSIEISKGQTFEATFNLNPDNKELEEVKVTDTRDKEWEKKMRDFEKEFLGRTSNARKTKILNPWVINFPENDEKALIATAREPVEVENLALGYKISVEMLAFTIDSKLYYFLAKTRFTELTPENEKQARQWIQKRQEAYLGSERHLFVSMIRGTVSQEGFELYTELKEQKEITRSPFFFNERGTRVIPFSLVVLAGKQDTYTLPLKSRLEVHYRNDNQGRYYRDDACRVFWIEPIKPPLTMNAAGILNDPTSIKIYGYVMYLRMADSLPVDYVPPEKGK